MEMFLRGTYGYGDGVHLNSGSRLKAGDIEIPTVTETFEISVNALV